MRRVVGIALVDEDLVDTTNSATFDAPKPPRHHTRHPPSPPPAGTLSVNPVRNAGEGGYSCWFHSINGRGQARGDAPVEKEGDLYRGATATGARGETTAPLGYRESNRSACFCSGLILHSLAYRGGRHPSTPTSSLFCAVDSKNEQTRGLIRSGRVIGAM
jgi:hypothetical protein